LTVITHIIRRLDSNCPIIVITHHALAQQGYSHLKIKHHYAVRILDILRFRKTCEILLQQTPSISVSLFLHETTTNYKLNASLYRPIGLFPTQHKLTMATRNTQTLDRI